MVEKFVDTREQLLAQSYDRHLSVSANAGSGKTTVLEKRFIGLLLKEWPNIEPRHLVAITFTRKAAAEIYARIAKGIEGVISGGDLTKRQHSDLIKIRERLNTAHISTIHSFCSSLIRDFPIESGVSPNFSELNEAEKGSIINNAITDTLAVFLTNDDEKTNGVKELIRAFGRQRIENYIKSILYKKDIYHKIKSFYEMYSDKQISGLAIETYLSMMFDSFNDSITNIVEILNFLIQSGIDSIKKTLISALEESLNYALVQLTEYNEKKTEELEFSFRDIEAGIELLIQEKVLTKQFALNKTTFRKYLDSVALEEYNKMLPDYFKVINILKNLENSEKQIELIQYSRTLLDITDSAGKLIEKEKEELGALDFDDILIKARDMLQNEDVSEKIRKRFRFLMVDEFQDTNDIQYDIVKSLVPQLFQPESEEKLKLFIVGDPKQSIYGFRNADVRVFRKASEDIKLANTFLLEKKKEKESIKTPEGESRQLSVDEMQGELELTVSFRHYPVIAAFTNRVCGNLMSRHESDYDVSYSPLVCSKNISELKKYSDNIKTNENEITPDIGAVSFVLAPKPDKNTQDELSEADMLAGFLLELVNNETGGKRYKYSDIAVLARTRTKFRRLTDAFQKCNIPYILHTGKGFYEAQEVKDIISILKFLHNPNDDLSLAGALRSPYFGISDSKILVLSNILGNHTLWEKAGIYTADNSKHKDMIHRAFEILSKLIRYSSRLSISHLIAQILELCSWYGTIAGSQSKAQVSANLQKLKQYAADFEKRGYKTLYDFVDEINLISKEDVTESEAVFITDDDAVNIMTIHAAKGLEFPVVALYDTNSAIKQRSGLFVDEELGFGFSVPVYDSDKQYYKYHETPLYQTAREKLVRKEKAESKRLLYVALTRAKERLVICATENSTNYSKSIFGLILDGMASDASTLAGEEINFNDELHIYHNEEIGKISITYNVELVRQIDRTPFVNEFGIEKQKLPELLMSDIHGESSNETYSATRMMTFLKDEKKYFSRYSLDFVDDGEDERVFSGGREPDDDLTGAEAGTIIHHVLEKIDLWLEDTGKVNNEKLENVISDTSKVFKKNFDNNFLKRVRRESLNVAGTDLILANVKNIKKSGKEIALNIPFANDYINATIDLVFQNTDSSYEVWDWKTNNVNDRKDMLKLAEYYEFQMKLYAYFLKLLDPGRESYKARLLFTQMAGSNAPDDKWTVEFNWTAEDLSSFEDRLNSEIQTIKQTN
ncbi:UvrD-helicase domain-containing protein [Bacteroidota bacterium]